MSEHEASKAASSATTAKKSATVSIAVDDARSARTQKSAAASCTRDPSEVSSLHAPDYEPLPPGVGRGVVVGCGKNRDSVMSAIPPTESCLFEEIMNDGERAECIRAEIEELKGVISELTCKEKLSEEDTLTLKNKQEELLQKIGELNDITRKIQRAIGMIDPSSVAFAKMFEMLPYPHKPCGRTMCGDDSEADPCGDQTDDCGAKTCEKFAFPQIDYPEDKLPRVIVCGSTEANFPKIVVADSRPKSRGNKCLEDLTGRLTESLCLQEKLAKENACLEGGKFQLEKELIEKDNAVECLERKICGLQAEMRLMAKENSELTKKFKCIEQQQQQQQRSCSPEPKCPRKQPELVDLSCKCSSREQSSAKSAAACRPPSQQGCCNNSPRLAGGGSRGDMLHQGGCGKPAGNNCGNQSQRGNVCPAEIEERLAAYGNNTKHLGQQLSCIETEVRHLQSELMHAQREKQQLSQQQKLLECANPCSTCNPDQPKSTGGGGGGCKSVAPQDSLTCTPCNESPECAVQQLRDLREQYARLQDDYKGKLCEVSRLRTDSECLKREAREAREERERLEVKLVDAQERARAIECERNELLGSKELLVEQEQALLVAKQRYREAQDELEELRTMIRDQAAQIDDYRCKYLQAQQQVEEQRRQLDLMEMDNARMNENVTLEIGRVKNQFQEKLAELAPLPDILKQTQVKLQETQQLRMLAEHNCEDLSRELLTAKDRIDAMQTQINDLQREIENLNEDKANDSVRIDELERKNSELRTENERLKNAVARFEEQHCAMQKRLDEKQHEIVQLNATLEQVREDSARQVSRTKERCEAIKKSMQSQISEFEIQLAQCRAAAKTAQKERDEIRQKMQGQIVNLNEALQQAQGRIRSLQGHVDYLKVSYSNVFGSAECPTAQMEMPPSNQGYDSCDCNY